MLKIAKDKLLIVFTALLFSSCGTTYIKEIIKPNGLINGKDKTAYLVVFDDLEIKTFKRTFKKKYKRQVDFVLQYSNTLSSELQKQKVISKIQFYNSKNRFKRNIYSRTADKNRVLNSIENNCKCDYLICIDGFEISDSHKSLLLDGNCIVKSRIRIINLSSKKIMEFESTGESENSPLYNYTDKNYSLNNNASKNPFNNNTNRNANMFLYDYTGGFEKAISESILNAVDYLKFGQTKFHKAPYYSGSNNIFNRGGNMFK